MPGGVGGDAAQEQITLGISGQGARIESGDGLIGNFAGVSRGASGVDVAVCTVGHNAEAVQVDVEHPAVGDQRETTRNTDGVAGISLLGGSTGKDEVVAFKTGVFAGSNGVLGDQVVKEGILDAPGDGARCIGDAVSGGARVWAWGPGSLRAFQPGQPRRSGVRERHRPCRNRRRRLRRRR